MNKNASYYKKIIWIKSSLLFVMLLAGCQSAIDEVINKHGEIENLARLNEFIANVNTQTEDEINYVQYGIEGQRGVETLTFDGEKLLVSQSVDGDFQENYSCQGIKLEQDGNTANYVISDCTGNFTGDFNLLSITTK